MFLDDDILVEPGYLTHLTQPYDMDDNKIVIGTWDLWPANTTPFSQSLYASTNVDKTNPVTELPFMDAFSNNMSLRREAYFKIGMMQALDFPGSSMWCDLDFNYRA